MLSLKYSLANEPKLNCHLWSKQDLAKVLIKTKHALTSGFLFVYLLNEDYKLILMLLIVTIKVNRNDFSLELCISFCRFRVQITLMKSRLTHSIYTIRVKLFVCFNLSLFNDFYVYRHFCLTIISIRGNSLISTGVLKPYNL